MCARGLRGRGADDDGDLARPDNPSRCTLPITALRVMPPSSAAIWLADKPSVQSFFSNSTRSSVQLMPGSSAAAAADRSTQNRPSGLGSNWLARRALQLPIYAED